jgi:cytidylate kinase
MCVSEKMIKIAIFGCSGSGKTTIAQQLAAGIGIPLRSCGTEIKSAAKAHGVSINELSDEIHATIDAETLRWVDSEQCCIVEGRFLAMMLDSTNSSIFFVKLVASCEERRKRLEKRGNVNLSDADLEKIDTIDKEFCCRNYKIFDRVRIDLEIDTTFLSVEECVQKIKAALKANP